MTDQERERWNAAVTAAQEDPSPENIARRDALKAEILGGIHFRVLEEDGYQERTR